ncbi:MFS transporter [Paractinoplanes atraurantiacus]|uniref:MFS transporter n=1 Tax=Paractinoplanes atraurantiacus TaxID=1036182 RepID=UPI0015CF276E|nr:MFS transporter [Actinoplanes atraurantiacus]
MLAGTSRITALVRHRSVRGPLLWSIIGRLPLYLISLALVLFFVEQDISYAATGGLLAAYTLGGSVLGPVIARRVDRQGQTWMLVVTAVLYPVLLIGTVSAVDGPRPLLIALLFLAGGAIPPVSNSIRALWSTMGLSKDERNAAYSLEAILAEVYSIGGPALLSLLIAIGDPRSAILAGGVMGGLGALGLATTRASRQWRPVPAKGDLLGPLRSPALLTMLGVLFFCAGSLGVFNIALPAFAEAHGSGGDVGLLFAAWGVGGAIGGIWYSGRRFRIPSEQLLLIVVLVFAALMAVPLLAWDNWSMGVALALNGLAVAPVTVVAYEFVGRAARAGTVTEAFTWMITANTAGSAVGAQLSGLLVNWSGTRAAFAAAVGMVLAGALVVLVFRRVLAAVPSGDDLEAEQDLEDVAAATSKES